MMNIFISLLSFSRRLSQIEDVVPFSSMLYSVYVFHLEYYRWKKEDKNINKLESIFYNMEIAMD